MILYDLILLLLFAVYAPVLYLKGKWHDQFDMRILGPVSISTPLPPEKSIWIHAVSVGEVLAIADLVEKIEAAFPSYGIVCSTVTKTGYSLAKETFKGKAKIIYAPLDFSWAVKRYIRFINPAAYIAAETEIWPNLFLHLYKEKVPVLLVNGRISDRSYNGYLRLRFCIKKILDTVNVFCMQTQQDAERITAIGADPHRVRVIGNVKFDRFDESVASASNPFGADSLVLVAGSTHPGEEEILLTIYKELAGPFPSLRLVICPRHVERAGEVVELVKKKDLKPVFLSKMDQEARSPIRHIVIVDTIGRLRDLYRSATVVFIGKTLTVGGGQNMIEPAAFGKPTIVGPMTQNFSDVMRLFLEDKAMIQIKDAAELKEQLSVLLKDQSLRTQIGGRAREVVQKYRGATARTLDVVKEIVKP